MHGKEGDGGEDEEKRPVSFCSWWFMAGAGAGPPGTEFEVVNEKIAAEFLTEEED